MNVIGQEKHTKNQGPFCGTTYRASNNNIMPSFIWGRQRSDSIAELVRLALFVWVTRVNPVQ